VELATGLKPFADLTGAQAALAITRGTRLARPESHELLDDETWSIMCDCWRTDPGERPTIDEVTRRVQQVLIEEARLNKDD